MSIPVLVERQADSFTASVLGSPQFRATDETKDKAVAALRAALIPRVSAGELVFVDVEPQGVAGLAGRYSDTPDWREMWDDVVTEAYRYRDELKVQEFPE